MVYFGCRQPHPSSPYGVLWLRLWVVKEIGRAILILSQWSSSLVEHGQPLLIQSLMSYDFYSCTVSTLE